MESGFEIFLTDLALEELQATVEYLEIRFSDKETKFKFCHFSGTDKALKQESYRKLILRNSPPISAHFNQVKRNTKHIQIGRIVVANVRIIEFKGRNLNSKSCRKSCKTSLFKNS